MFDVHSVRGGWSEDALTAANAPGQGRDELIGIPVSPQDRNRFLVVDLTELVQEWLDRTLENNGLVLMPNAAGVSVEFDSKENAATSHEPELEITLRGPQASAGPPGPPGPPGRRHGRPAGSRGRARSAGPAGSARAQRALRAPPALPGSLDRQDPVDRTAPPGLPAGGAGRDRCGGDGAPVLAAPIGGLREYRASGTWTAPAGVTRVMVEAWGAGGAGGPGSPGRPGRRGRWRRRRVPARRAGGRARARRTTSSIGDGGQPDPSGGGDGRDTQLRDATTGTVLLSVRPGHGGRPARPDGVPGAGGARRPRRGRAGCRPGRDRRRSGRGLPARRRCRPRPASSPGRGGASGAAPRGEAWIRRPAPVPAARVATRDARGFPVARATSSFSGEGATVVERTWAAYLIVFVASGCTLVLELVAGRILAPFVGVSIHTWTSIIGVVLAGISLGNYLGGVVADRAGSGRTLGDPPRRRRAGERRRPAAGERSRGARAADYPLVLRIVLLTTLLFFLPSLLLGMVPPVAIKHALGDLGRAGKVVGRRLRRVDRRQPGRHVPDGVRPDRPLRDAGHHPLGGADAGRVRGARRRARPRETASHAPSA